jgi:hypothetical protein
MYVKVSLLYCKEEFIFTVCCLISFSGANILSVLFVAACSLPFEYVMTQIHKMQPDSEGKYPYTGFLDCAIKTFKVGGPAKFYSEYPNYYGRVSPILIVILFYLYYVFLTNTAIIVIVTTIVILNLFSEGVRKLIYCSWQMACFFLNQLQNGRNVVGDGKDEGMSSTLGA